MVQNLDKICRICLNEALKAYNNLMEVQIVAKQSQDHEETVTYLEMFQLLTGYGILPDEPQQFCKNCAINLKIAFELKSQCEEAQTYLESIRAFETTEVKVEIKEDDSGSTLDAASYDVEQDDFKDEHVGLQLVQENQDSNQSDEQQYECEICSTSFKQRKSLMQHYRSFHADQRIHECRHCKNTFYTSSLLESHANACKRRPRTDKQQEKKKHLCPVCGKPSSNNHILYHTQRQVKQDLNQSGSKQIFICDICGTKVSTRYSMINHMKVQHFNQRTKCKYCDTTFRYPTQLSVHVRRIHRQETPVFKCGKCDFIAPSETYLQRHRTTHSGKKPFNCTICNYECFKKIEFENHMASHSDARPFTCEVCNSAFKTKKALHTHKKTHGDYDYECPVCNQGFYSNHLMRAHARKAHPDYEMPPPGTVFSKTALKRLAEKEMQERAMRSGSDINSKTEAMSS